MQDAEKVNTFKHRMNTLAYGEAMMAAARDYGEVRCVAIHVSCRPGRTLPPGETCADLPPSTLSSGQLQIRTTPARPSEQLTLDGRDGLVLMQLRRVPTCAAPILYPLHLPLDTGADGSGVQAARTQ